jgi:DNA-binding MarR family transcriptional regulator
MTLTRKSVREKIVRLHDEGDITVSALVERFGLARSTICRMIKKKEEKIKCSKKKDVSLKLERRD